MTLERWRWAIPVRLRALLRPRAVEREHAEELRFHLERQAESYAAEGMTSSGAWAAARRALGAALAPDPGQPNGPRPRGVPTGALRDVRHALRVLRRAPGFAA